MIRAVTPLFPRNCSRPFDLANYHSMLPTNRVTVLEARQRRQPSALEILHGLDRSRRWRGPRRTRPTNRQRHCEHTCTHDGHRPTAQLFHEDSLQSWAVGPNVSTNINDPLTFCQTHPVDHQRFWRNAHNNKLIDECFELVRDRPNNSTDRPLLVPSGCHS